MLEAWTWPAYVALLLGGVLAIPLFIPIIALESRRFGRVTFRRMLGAVSAAIYGVAIIAYTLLPLPAPEWCTKNRGAGVELIPFHSFADIAKDTAGYSLLGVLTSAAVLQVVFNVVLFIPFGALARRLLLARARVAIISAAATSLLIETAQGTGLFGAYNCAYRVADVDDFLTNTLGAAIGVWLAPLLLGWLPGEELKKSRSKPRAVNRSRRLATALVDLMSLLFITASFLVVERVIGLNVLAATPRDLEAPVYQIIAASLAAAVVIMPCIMGRRASIGQRALWLAPVTVEQHAHPPFNRALVRTITGIGGYALLLVASSAELVPESLGVWWLLISAGGIIFDRSARGISHRLAKLTLEDARSEH